MDLHLKTLGDADLEFNGFRLWIHGRQFEQASDYWDGNWLNVTARVDSVTSHVSASGSFVHLSELAGLLRGCEQVYTSLKGRAELDCMEPNLFIALEGTGAGGVNIEIRITPDHMRESHRYLTSFDQTYLPPIIAACRRIFDKYPIREAEKMSL